MSVKVDLSSREHKGTDVRDKSPYTIFSSKTDGKLKRWNFPGNSITWLKVLLTAQIVIIVSLVSFMAIFYQSVRSDIDDIRSQIREKSLGAPEAKPTAKRSVGHPTPHGLLEESGLEAVQMTGSLPLLQIKKNGTIGPWVIEKKSNWAALSKDRSELQILLPGLYFIYAQVYYLTSEISNSFEIIGIRKNETRTIRETLSLCASKGVEDLGGGSSEVSCYTAVVRSLVPPVRIVLNQIEQNRVILSSPGFSHWGLIKL